MEKKTDFVPKKCFLVECKNGRFSVIPAGTRSIVIVCHFWMAPTAPPSFVNHGPKLRVLIIAIGHWPKMAKIQAGGQKTARQAAKPPPTRKPKLSRVTSGYGGLMIPLSWVRLSQKKWGFHRCSIIKCRILGQKCSFLAQNPFFCQKRPTFLLPS